MERTLPAPVILSRQDQAAIVACVKLPD